MTATKMRTRTTEKRTKKKRAAKETTTLETETIRGQKSMLNRAVEKMRTQNDTTVTDAQQKGRDQESRQKAMMIATMT